MGGTIHGGIHKLLYVVENLAGSILLVRIQVGETV